MYTKINHTNLDLVKENDVKIKNGNNDTSDDDENDTEYNEDNEYDKNNYDIYIEILIQMFCNILKPVLKVFPKIIMNIIPVTKAGGNRIFP